MFCVIKGVKKDFPFDLIVSEITSAYGQLKEYKKIEEGEQINVKFEFYNSKDLAKLV